MAIENISMYCYDTILASSTGFFKPQTTKLYSKYVTILQILSFKFKDGGGKFGLVLNILDRKIFGVGGNYIFLDFFKL